MRLSVWCSLVAGLGWGQSPVVESVRNAATMAEGARFSVTPQGAIIAIIGKNLAPREGVANETPLPTELEGTSVTIDGVRAPLFYVSPGQINAQHPQIAGKELSLEAYDLVVHATAGSSNAVPIHPWKGGFGAFTVDGSGCGPAHVYNIRSDGSWIKNSPETPATPSSYLVILGTGRGPTSPALPDGTPAPLESNAQYRVGGAAGIGLFMGQESQRVVGNVAFEGRAPGMIGVDQLNLRLISAPPAGCNLPVRLTFRGAAPGSQTFPLSIAREDGPCVEPVRHDALLQWRKVMTAEPGTGAEELLVSLTAHETDIAATYPRNSEISWYLFFQPGPACPELRRVKRLDLGELLVTSKNCAPCRFSPEIVDGEPQYRVRLPEGAIGEGLVRAEFTGKDGSGPLRSELNIPAPIRITGTFPPAVMDRQTSVLWSGGEADSLVRLELRMGRTGEPPEAFKSQIRRVRDGGVGLSNTGAIVGGTIDIILTNLKQFVDVEVKETPVRLLRSEWVYEWRYRCSTGGACKPLP